MNQLWRGVAELAWPVRRSAPWLLVDLSLTVAVGVAMYAISRATWAREILPQASVVLALAAGATAVAASGLASIVTRLSRNPHTSWIAAAMGLYGIVAVPATAIGAKIGPVDSTIGITRLTTHGLVVCLLLVAWRPPGRCYAVRCESLFVLVAALTGVVGLTSLAVPSLAVSLSTNTPVRYVVSAGWVLSGLLLVVRGLPIRAAGRSVPLARVGLGVVVLAFAHFYRVVTEPAQPSIAPGLVFSGVRLLAVALILYGLVGMTRVAIVELDRAKAHHEERLLERMAGLDRLAERDDELRSGLAGLASAATSTWETAKEEDQQQLRESVSAQLAHLCALLDRRHTDTASGQHVVDVTELLGELASSWRARGTDIDCEVTSELHAAIPAAVLTRVLTIVLSNCAEHAPGTPVRVHTYDGGDRIQIWITDGGPGVPPGTAVSASGTAGETPRAGLGLHVSHTLLATHGATISVRPRSLVLPGSTVVVELPAAQPDAQPDDDPDRDSEDNGIDTGFVGSAGTPA